MISFYEVRSNTTPIFQVKKLWLRELKQLVQDIQLVTVRVMVWMRARQVKHLGHKMSEDPHSQGQESINP